MVKFVILSLAILFANTGIHAQAPDISAIARDLITPRMTTGAPAPGKRVKQVSSEYKGTRVYHALYLPADWQQGKQYPVIVEYAGNGPYKNNFGDTCTGKVEDCSLGYGISGGTKCLWICLPYISQDHQRNQLSWWGDVEATVNYCKTVVPRICQKYGGDPSAVFLAGFSRGAIACNYIGLHDDQIADLWTGFIAHSHYDGVRQWNYPDSDRNAALKRLKRLQDKPQFISHEGSIDAVKQYLNEASPKGRFTFQVLPYRNHTDTWVLRNIPERKAIREWMQSVLAQER